MERVKLKKTLNINYIEMFTKEWAKVLNPLLTSPYMFNLLALLQEMYDLIEESFEGNQFIFPNKKEYLFENFRCCPYDSLRVVVIGKEPYDNENATGIPFAMPTITPGMEIEPQLKLIEQYVSQEIHDNHPKYLFDETFNCWSYQGVLLLDTASTCEKGTELAHAEYWRNFTREVIKLINDDKKDLIFMLWGHEAKYFEKFIDKNKHYVLYNKHPSESIVLDELWDGSNLQKTDLLLQKINEDDKYSIYW